MMKKKKRRTVDIGWNEREMMEKLRNENDDVPYTCRSDICREIWTYSREKGDLLWPDVPVGTVHRQVCPYSLTGSQYVTYRCRVNAWGNGVEWVEHTDNLCPKPPFSQLADVIQSIIQDNPHNISCRQVTQLTHKMVDTQKKYVTYPTLSEDFKFVIHFLSTLNMRCLEQKGFNGRNEAVIKLHNNNNIDNNKNYKNNNNYNDKNNYNDNNKYNNNNNNGKNIINVNNIIINDDDEDDVVNLFQFIDTFFYPNFLAHWENKDNNFTRIFQILERFSRRSSSSSPPSLSLSTPFPLLSSSSSLSPITSSSFSPSSSSSSSSSTSYKSLHISHTTLMDGTSYFEYPNNVTIAITLSGNNERRLKVIMIENFSKCNLIAPMKRSVENLGGNVTEIRPRILDFGDINEEHNNYVFKNNNNNNNNDNGFKSDLLAIENNNNNKNRNNNNNNNNKNNNRNLVGSKRRGLNDKKESLIAKRSLSTVDMNINTIFNEESDYISRRNNNSNNKFNNKNNNMSIRQKVLRRYERMVNLNNKNNKNFVNNKNNDNNKNNNKDNDNNIYGENIMSPPSLEITRLANTGPIIYVSDDIPASEENRRDFDVEMSFYFEPFIEEWRGSFPVKYFCARLIVDISEKNLFLDDSKWRFDCLTTVFPSNQSVVCSCKGPAFVSVFHNIYRARLFDKPEVADVDVFGFRMTSELVIATMVLRGISIAALLATTFIFSFFKKTRKGVATKILLNLCVSLMLLLLLMFIADQRANNRKECPVYNVLRYYLCMVTLMWNGVEGHNMHQMLVKVFNTRVRWYVRKAAVVAWTIPALIVIIVLAVDLKAFHGTWKECIFGCSLKPTTLYIAWLTPMLMIVIHNMIVFGLVLKALSSDAPNHPGDSTQQRDRKSFKQRLTGAVALLVLLGIPWLLSAFAAVQTKEGELMESLQFAVGVVFTLFISIQGVFIFLFHCLRNHHVKTHLSSLTSSGRKMFSSTSGSRLTSAKRSRDCLEEKKMADIEIRDKNNNEDEKFN